MKNKIIWSLWYQGVDKAPTMVQECWKSWKKHNPDYEFKLLDQTSLFEYVNFHKLLDLNRKDLTIQKISALSRIHLLNNYGGIWVDATLFCIKPLDSWLDEHMQEGFFVFDKPGPDRLSSNWFIAANPGNVLIETLTKEFTDLYVNNNFTFQNTWVGKYIVDLGVQKFNTSDMTDFWLSNFNKKVLRVYPYFIFHYTFNKIIKSNSYCKEIWDRVPKINSKGPHLLQNYYNKFKHTGEGLKEALVSVDKKETPLYKLNWRWNESTPYWDQLLPYLYKTIDIAK